MTKERLIRSLVGLGQSIPRNDRITVFEEIARSYVTAPENHLDDTTESKNNVDIKKSIDLINRAIDDAAPEYTKNLLVYIANFINIFEDRLSEQARFESSIEYVVTQPEYLMEKTQAAASAPLWGGSLFDAIYKMLNHARRSVDIINPYWSVQGVDRLLRDLETTTCHFRILTMVAKENEKAIENFISKIKSSGGTIDIYSPTQEQIEATDALAPIHAKLILCDGEVAYIGSANLSKGGLENGLEIGAIHRGYGLRTLVSYVNWLFENSETTSSEVL